MVPSVYEVYPAKCFVLLYIIFLISKILYGLYHSFLPKEFLAEALTRTRPSMAMLRGVSFLSSSTLVAQNFPKGASGATCRLSDTGVQMDSLSRLSAVERQAFSVALLLGSDVEPVMWMYVGQQYGKYKFRHKVHGWKVVTV